MNGKVLGLDDRRLECVKCLLSTRRRCSTWLVWHNEEFRGQTFENVSKQKRMSIDKMKERHTTHESASGC